LDPETWQQQERSSRPLKLFLDWGWEINQLVLKTYGGTKNGDPIVPSLSEPSRSADGYVGIRVAPSLDLMQKSVSWPELPSGSIKSGKGRITCD
jgi:hypothetical protein